MENEPILMALAREMGIFYGWYTWEKDCSALTKWRHETRTKDPTKRPKRQAKSVFGRVTGRRNTPPNNNGRNLKMLRWEKQKTSTKHQFVGYMLVFP